MRFTLSAAAHRRAGRARSSSLSAIPPPEDSDDYIPELATIAASILYRSPLPSPAGRPIYILNAAAFPDAFEVDYDSLLSYVLARLPAEDELISGAEYEIIFFAGGQPDNATAEKKQGPSTGWYLQAYHVLGRATRKKLQMLYIVHPRTWVRVLISIFGTIVSPKFRRKIVHVNSISGLAFHIPIENLLIPPSAYLHDRKVSPEVYAPYATGRRAFGARHPLPKNITTKESRLPRVLRETTCFILMSSNIKTEGLFRIPPQSMLAGILKEAYDRGQQFIIWKEADAVLAPPGLDKSVMDEVRVEDTYGIHLAASLIKTWYRELKEPLFPDSCYGQLEDRYGDASKGITVEDVVDIILPASHNSPLTLTARHILIRHLLPLLSAVASHADENKMSAENLAILFSMCLLRGPNQLEDTRVSNTVRRILIEAINTWPQLRTGLNIGVQSFDLDLRPPSDPRDYEDPLEDDSQRHSVEVATTENRITMNDSDDHIPAPERAPTLPPRRSRAASLKAALAAPHHMIDALPSLGKRKPINAVPNVNSGIEQPEGEDPPRYSTVFDRDGHSVHFAESPTDLGPSNGFGPPRRSGLSFDENEKSKGMSKGELENAGKQTDGQPFNPSGLLAQITAPTNASDISHRAGVDSTPRLDAKGSPSSPIPANTYPVSHEEIRPGNNSDQRKTSTKSSNPTGLRRPSDIHSLARPIVPVSSFRQNDNSGLSTGTVPKPRAPSPGLLKRMTSIENVQAQQKASAVPQRPKLEPKRLTLQKQSVDDLRRLYEDRVDTAINLEAAAHLTNDRTDG